MSEDQNYKRVYTGPETNVQYLQDLFEKSGIHSRVRNDFDSGLRAGFGGGLPGQVLLFVENDKFAEATEIARTTFPKDFDNE
ncbi:putative signal transducing protein [Christiangramia aquimixticola]|uniref:putative signal transducing protein n=1 Tax=Christiangramia aquimixticola TaxID=1697558 RepID=UPI003AA8754C